jgi:hypothetical protein
MMMKYAFGLIALGALASACTPPCKDQRCSGGYGPVPTDPQPEMSPGATGGQPPNGGAGMGAGGGALPPPPTGGGGVLPPPPQTGGVAPQPQPPVQTPVAAPIPQTGARDCADQGKSCETDSVVADWLTKCRGSNNAPGPCHCAAAATWACFNTHHCFSEAGAPTTLTQAQIRSSFDTEITGATAAQTQCNLLHP